MPTRTKRRKTPRKLPSKMATADALRLDVCSLAMALGFLGFCAAEAEAVAAALATMVARRTTCLTKRLCESFGSVMVEEPGVC